MFKADGGVRAAIVVGDSQNGSTAAYFGDIRAFVYSVDAATGALRWKKQVDTHRAARVTGSPVLYGGRLYVPVSSTEEARRRAGRRTSAAPSAAASSRSIRRPANELWRTYMITEAPTPRGEEREGHAALGTVGRRGLVGADGRSGRRSRCTSRPATPTRCRPRR